MNDDLVASDAELKQRLLGHLDPSERRRIVIWSVTRMIVAAVVLIGVYFALPFDRASVASSWLVVLLALVGLTIVDVFQLRAITASHAPTLRGMEALIVSLTVMLVTFAGLYLGMSGREPDAFSEPLDHVDSLYFTLTTLTTIGYGDIAPLNNNARVVVMVQMIVNVIVIGVFVKLVTNTVKSRLSAREDSTPTPPAG